MRIVHVVTSFNVGGIETMLVDIMNEQVKTQEVTLIVLNNQVNNLLVKKISGDVYLHFIQRPRGSINPIYFIRFNALLWKIKPDVIHCHQISTVKYILNNRLPVVITIHGINTTDNVAINKYNKVFAISKAVQLNIKQVFKRDSLIVYNGINFQEVKKKQRKTFEKFGILNVSSLNVSVKGQNYLIEAINILVNRYNLTEIELVLIGEGESRTLLESLINKWDLNYYIKIIGLRNRSYIYNHLSDFDLFVQPSNKEGFGLTVVEAMAAKVPVIVSDIDGPFEIIENGKYGFYFEKGNSQNLAQKILYVINNYPEAVEKANMACQYIAQKFDIKTTVNKYIQEYKTLYSKKSK